MNISAVTVAGAAATKFAPQAEVATIVLDPASQPNTYTSLIFTVEDRLGRVVYLERSPINTAQWTWAGLADATAPDAPTGWANPLDAPYRLRAWGYRDDSTGLSAALDFFSSVRRTVTTLRLPATPPVPTQRQLEVLYHSIEIERGGWLPDEELARLDGVINPQAPGFAAVDVADADVIWWVWHRLASLGYFPGPRPPAGQVSDELGLAIRRYRQNHPELHRRDFRLENAASALDAQVDGDLRSIDVALLQMLHAGDNNRLDNGAAADDRLLEHDDALSHDGQDSKLYLDVDRFYISFPEFSEDRRHEVDSAWLPRPALPIRARIYIQDHLGNRVDYLLPREVLADTRLVWTWDDVALDTSTLPSSQPDRPSQTQRYVDAAIAAMAQATVSPRSGARVAVGGLISGNAGADDAAAFATCAPYPMVPGGNGVRSTPNPDPDGDRSSWNETVVYLNPSRIAGDNYRVEVRLELPDVRRDAHADVEDNLAATTGRVEVWRRIRVAAVMKWGAGLAINNWAPLQAEYAHACTRVVSPVREFTLAQVPGPERAGLDQAFARMCEAARLPNEDQQSQAEFAELSTDSLWPYDPRNVEFRKLMDLGANQFAPPIAIVNDLMIGTMARDWLDWRRKPIGGKPTNPCKARWKMATRWSQSGGWVAAVGDFFLQSLGRILNPAGTTVLNLARAERYMDPLPHDWPGLDTIPAQADLVLEELIRTVDLGDPQVVTEVRGFMREVGRAFAKSQSDTEGNDKIDAYSRHHPTLERWLIHYQEFFQAGSHAPLPAPFPALSDAERDDDHAWWKRCLALDEAFALRDRVNELCGSFFQMHGIEHLYDIARDPNVPGARPASGITLVYYKAHPRPSPITPGGTRDFPDLSYGTSIGIDAGVAVACADIAMDQTHLLTHEIAHCLFLTHWQHAQDTVDEHFSNPHHHDMDDANCVMSYPNWDSAARWPNGAPSESHFRNDVYQPSFCGKCNLRLRGWDVSAAQLPARSLQVTLLEPMAPLPQLAQFDTVNTAQLQQRAHDLISRELGIVLGGGNFMQVGAQTFKPIANPAPVDVGGKPRFRWASVPANAVDGGAVAVAQVDIEQQGESVEQQELTHAEILAGPNSTYVCAWERNHDFIFTNGGATNADPLNPPYGDVILNCHSSLSSADVMVHEVFHIYQSWDDEGKMQEGITELFGMMLSHQHYLGNPGLNLNPSYIQFTQIVVDEVLPRIGVQALAGLYFLGDETGLGGVLRPPFTAGDFKKAFQRVYKDHDPRPATAMLLPLADCVVPPAADPSQAQGRQLALDAIASHYTPFMQQRAVQLGLQGAPNSIVARAIRVQNVIDVYDNAVAAARQFRNDVDDTRRVHRLEAWIEATREQMLVLEAKLP